MKNRIEISLLFIFLSTLFTARGQYTTFNAVVSEPGTLKVAIGDRWNAIDSLVVNGPINAEDFNIIYQSIRYGRVDVLNLEKAQLENNELPNVAFCKDDGYRLYIRRIMLPDNIVKFDRAALYKTEIESINIPSSLQEIDELAFGYSYLGIPKLILPEGITKIPHSCFFQTQGIEEVVLPSSVKTIDIYGFAQNTIREVNIPEGVDSIGGWAFLTSVTAPGKLSISIKLVKCFHPAVFWYMSSVPTGINTGIFCAMPTNTRSLQVGGVCAGQYIFCMLVQPLKASSSIYCNEAGRKIESSAHN